MFLLKKTSFVEKRIKIDNKTFSHSNAKFLLSYISNTRFKLGILNMRVDAKIGEHSKVYFFQKDTEHEISFLAKWRKWVSKNIEEKMTSTLGKKKKNEKKEDKDGGKLHEKILEYVVYTFRCV